MADTDYSALINMGLSLANAGVTYATATASQRQALDALAQAQKQIAQGQANFSGIGTPKYNPTDIKSTQVGRSELGDIQNDPQGRVAEQQAMAELQKLADNGGLSLADMKSLNDIQSNLNQNASSRDAALRNQYAARGQLGGGAQLAMELNQNQQAGQRANSQGESIAAQAQARALAAIKEKAGLGRQMSQDEYDKAARAAQANDLIKQHNVANSMQANQQNNQWLNQGFQNDLSKAQGQAGLIGLGVQQARDVGAVNQAYTNGVGGAIKGAVNGVAAGVKQNGSSPTSPDSTTPPPLVNSDGSLAGGGGQPDANGWAQFGTTKPSEAPTVDDYDPNKLHEGD